MDQRQSSGSGPGSDELSFGDFRNQVLLFRRFLVAVGGYIFAVLKRYYLVFVLLLAGFLALGYYQYKNQNAYTATAYYVYTELNKKTYGEMVDKLEDMIRSGSYRRVADALAITEDEARKITSISARNSYGSKLSEDITNKDRSFYITVVTTDNKLFGKLQQVLEAYLNGNLLAEKMVAQKVQKMEGRLIYLEAEAARLDSLKMAYTHSLEKNTTTVSPNNNPFNPVELYEKSGTMNQEILELKALLADKRAVITGDKFMVREHPREKDLKSVMITYTVLFVAASLVLIGLISFFRQKH